MLAYFSYLSLGDAGLLCLLVFGFLFFVFFLKGLPIDLGSI